MKYAEHIADLVGQTPLVKLNSVAEGVDCTVLVKVEYLNPGGSIKDRIAERIITAAEEEGKLKPGGTIVEPTSGNTGVGLALIGQRRGYQCIFVCPDKVSTDKRDVLKAYGAQVVVCPTAVAPSDPRSFYSVSDRLAKEIPGAFKPDQYSNLNGPAAHYATTGPEIWDDTDGKVTHFVCGIGTGGTISGTGNYLKEKSADRESGPVKIVAADPEGSIFSGGRARPYLVEGVGEDMYPDAYDRTVTDEVIMVADKEAFEMTRRLAREEGLHLGGSSGMAVAAALRMAKDLPAEAVVVVVAPDSGRGYMSKIFNDEWMGTQGFMDDEVPDAERFARDGGETPRVRDVLEVRAGSLPPIVHVMPETTVGDAFRIMHEQGLSQLVVAKCDPPLRGGEVLGAVTEEGLCDSILSGGATNSSPVGDHVSSALPLVGDGQTVPRLREVLNECGAALVMVGGNPTAVITRSDLVAYLTR